MTAKKTLSLRNQFTLERLQANLTHAFEFIELAGREIKDGQYRAAISYLSTANNYLIDCMLNNERFEEENITDALDYLAIARKAVKDGVKLAKQD